MPLGLERRHNLGHLHFITFSCYRRLPYLETSNPKDVLEQVIERARRSHDFLLYAYVLMPEHVHLLLSEPKKHSLSSTLRVIKGESSKILKGPRNNFWQPRYTTLTSSRHPSSKRKSNTFTETLSPEGSSPNRKTTAGAASTTTPPANRAPSKSNPNGPPTGDLPDRKH
jgi:REP element-mobilizing transposase RayT